jgi:hypothetical protein
MAEITGKLSQTSTGKKPNKTTKKEEARNYQLPIP